MKHLPELRTVQCFATVVREGNVTRAAKKLHLSQPAVTQQLKNLAERSGLTLFTRTAKGLVLTPDGAILAQKAEQVLSVLDEFRQTARDLSGHVRGSLRIGTILDPGFICLNTRRQDPVISAAYDILLAVWEKSMLKAPNNTTPLLAKRRKE